MSDTYPQRYQELVQQMGKLQQATPDVMKGFGALHHAGIQAGALSTKDKELIALGIAICVRCDGCIAYHVHDAIEAGATRQEVIETIGVAILMGGGPSTVYGAEALTALDEFTQERVA